jgi:hypothetical protein
VRGQSFADVLISVLLDNLSREQSNRVQTPQYRASEMRTSPSDGCGRCDDRVEIAFMSDEPVRNSLHGVLMDAYIGWIATQTKGHPDIQVSLAEVVSFVREMINHIDPTHETERLEAIAFALQEVADAMQDLISVASRH